MHAQCCNDEIDSNQILHINARGELSDVFEMVSKLVRRFLSGVGVKI